MAAVSGLTLLLGTALGGTGAGVVVDVPASSLLLSPLTPAVLTTGPIEVPAASIVLTPLTPAVLTSALVDIPATSVVLTPLAPAVATGAVAAVPAATITFTALAPTVSGSAIVAVPAAVLALTPLAPSIPPPAAVFVPLASISFAPLEPVVYADQVILVPAAAVVFDTAAPVISTTILIDVPAVSVVMTPLAPVIGLSPAIIVPAAPVQFIGHAPILFVSSDDYAVVDGIKQVDYSLTAFINAVPVADGVFSVFSRRYGYTYGHFDVYPAGAPGANAVIPSRVDPSITLTEGQVSALSAKVSISFGDILHDLGNGAGTRPYKGTILLSGGCTLPEAYQYLQWITRDGSTTMLNGVPGWMYRRLHPTYPDSPEAPFGVLMEGVFYVAQGWLLLGVSLPESDKYRLVSHDGVVQVPPNAVAITIGNLVAGDQVLVGRALGATILRDEYTPLPAVAGATSLSVQEDISTDTPSSGVIRIRNRRYTYAGVSRATKTFGGISPALVIPVVVEDDVFVPFIDRQAAGPTESAVFTFGSQFDARVFVRNGTVSPIVPFTATVLVTQDGAAVNVSRTTDL